MRCHATILIQEMPLSYNFLWTLKFYKGSLIYLYSFLKNPAENSLNVNKMLLPVKYTPDIVPLFPFFHHKVYHQNPK